MERKKINGNIIIAEFMGAVIDGKTKDCDDPTYIFPEPPDKFNIYTRYSVSWLCGKREYSNDEPRYDNSWNWIVPVLSKIHKIHEYTEMDGDEFLKGEQIIRVIETAIGKTDIIQVFNSVVKFIEWYKIKTKKEEK